MLSDDLPSSQKCFLAPHFPQSALHLHVSECVDQRIEHGYNDGVEKGKHFIFWKSCGWSNVNEENRHKKQDHNCNVRTASGKSFGTAPCRESPDGV